MIINDLRDKWIKDRDLTVQIKHKNNKDVRYWPTSLTDTKEVCILNGFWICKQTNNVLVQEEIKIKK